jgi:hypothetical protein
MNQRSDTVHSPTALPPRDVSRYGTASLKRTKGYLSTFVEYRSTSEYLYVHTQQHINGMTNIRRSSMYITHDLLSQKPCMLDSSHFFARSLLFRSQTTAYYTRTPSVVRP